MQQKWQVKWRKQINVKRLENYLKRIAAASKCIETDNCNWKTSRNERKQIETKCS